MTTEDAPPLTRRSRRSRAQAPADARTAAAAGTDAAPADSAPADSAPDTAAGDSSTPGAAPEAPAAEPPASDAEASVADASADPAAVVLQPTAPTAPSRHVALGWVDEDSLATAPTALSLNAAAAPYTVVHPDLLARRPHRSPFRAGVLVPLLSVLAVIALYVATTLLWPLHALPPQVTPSTVVPVAAPAAAPAWPAAGAAAVSVDGIDASAASSVDPISMASLTKVVTVLMVLDEMPLAPGEQGPEFQFTGADQSEYWAYRERGESALPVPAGGTLTQYQLLQGILIASANNYADRLASVLWPSDDVFANAAASWLSQHGLSGITVVDPSGIDDDNTADPAALLALADRALADPVVAEIVRMPTAELPGAGLIENTNALLADPGVVGVKTGSLWEHYNLIAAKDLLVGDTTVRVYASVLGQPTSQTRTAAARALLAQLEAELQLRPSVTAGTVAGVVTTAWGERVDMLTSDDASVVLWNGGAATVTSDLTVGEDRAADTTVGTLTVTGPLDAETVEVHLAAEIEDPTPWWRLTHPLELFGLAG
ncbi:D-alanyl-D-alanine carboxypeptidase [Microbacterium sp. zg-YB36]|uniref:D-alanyl-D-alanine carboxypeptidase n=1 Tax=Microbacterium sp. zg-YB36 TaxID=2969407 RepID=UPI00214AC946|nr:D-alanyl-D-alanine carboxypeptidase [Microbacterium sp. zg-YB36]MDL5351873.1 D-alanyl-D-alanine carboxypeptidase [Microbacterium sp. zg-YB36]